MPRKIKASRERLSPDAVRRRKDRGDVLIQKVGQAKASIRVVWIFAGLGILCLTGITILLRLPMYAMGILGVGAINALFCELVLVKNLSRHEEWARKLGIVYLVFATCAAFVIPPFLTGVFIAISTIRGIAALSDAKTKDVFAREREKAAGRRSVLESGSVCAECQQNLSENEFIEVSGKKICADCKDWYTQKLRENVA